jgi:hypothetical protein
MLDDPATLEKLAPLADDAALHDRLRAVRRPPAAACCRPPVVRYRMPATWWFGLQQFRTDLAGGTRRRAAFPRYHPPWPWPWLRCSRELRMAYDPLEVSCGRLYWARAASGEKERTRGCSSGGSGVIWSTGPASGLAPSPDRSWPTASGSCPHQCRAGFQDIRQGPGGRTYSPGG